MLRLATIARTSTTPSRALATKAHYASTDYYDNSRIPTYAFQDSLPRLPVPKLNDTLDK